jgi:hypothetical protein
MRPLVPYRAGRYEFHLGPHWPGLLHLRVPADAEPLAEVEVHAIRRQPLTFRGSRWGPEVHAVLLLSSVRLRVMREGGPTWPNAGPLSPRTLAAWRLLPEDRLTLTTAQRWDGQVALLPLRPVMQGHPAPHPSQRPTERHTEENHP